MAVNYERYGAIFQIIAQGKDVTRLFQDRLIEIKLVDKPGMDSDECTIRLDDRDGALDFPSKGATLKISLGWDGQPLNYMGTYAVDEISWSDGPDQMTIKGKPADMRAAAKSHGSKGFENTTLKAVAGAIAAKHGWALVCNVDEAIDRADQLGESDIHFITRIARKYGATATVKDKKLIVMQRGGGVTAGGKAMPAIVVTRGEISPGSFSISFPDRTAHGAVKTSVHDSKTGKRKELEVVDASKPDVIGGAVHKDRHVYSSEAAAKSAARSKMESLNRATCSGSFESLGNPDYATEKKLTLTGFRPGVDGDYLIEEVENTFSGKSWVSRVSFNAGNGGKSSVGHGKKKPATKTIDASK